MISLKKYDFAVSYIKKSNEVYELFYKPCFQNSIKYDRVVGYFSSNIFTVINDSLINFIKNGGKIRMICSPELDENDYLHMKKGYDELFQKSLAQYMNEIIIELQKDYPNSVSLLSNLISSGILEIKLAVLGNDSFTYASMHDKVGVFKDDQGNAVSFRGSVNETLYGIADIGNFESIDVSISWDEGRDAERVKIAEEQFNKMWQNEINKVKIYSIPETTLELIKTVAFKETNLKKLYEASMCEIKQKKISVLKEDNYEQKWYADLGPNPRKIRKHQKEVLNNWEKNNRKGLFEMCTGSGKTFTAMCAIREAIYEKKEVPLILVPTIYLMEQWFEEIRKSFCDDNLAILKIGGENQLSANQLYKLRNYSRPSLNTKRCIISTYSSAKSLKFISNLNQGTHIFLICDEVHAMGASQTIKLLDLEVGARIGLSATPRRHFDNYSTQKIYDYFDGVIEPIYTLEQGIKDKVLVPYDYFIKQIELTSEEQIEYNNMTRTINQRIAALKGNNQDFNFKGEIMKNQKLLKLFVDRSKILKTAENKIKTAKDILINTYKQGQEREEKQKWLVYFDSIEQLEKFADELKKEKYLEKDVLKYYSSSYSDREVVMNRFKDPDKGGILLAIYCLDEGVDIPAAEYALILASSRNERQYIQRRGRVLRQSYETGKTRAVIFDLIVIPNNLVADEIQIMSIINGEIARASEFAKNARNKEANIIEINSIINKFNINIEKEIIGGFEDEEEEN